MEGEGTKMPSPMEFLKQAEEQRAQENKLTWEGKFSEYLDVVAKNPSVSSLAHARMHQMIVHAGVEEREEGRPKDYKFFRHEIFGLDRTQQQLVRSEERRVGKE